MWTIKEENKFISFIFFHMIIIIYKSFKCIQYPHYKIIWMYTWRTVFWSVSFGNNCSREQNQLKWEIIFQNLRKTATDEKKQPQIFGQKSKSNCFQCNELFSWNSWFPFNLIDCILILDTFYLLEFWEEKKVVSLCMRFQRMQHIKYLFIKCVH